MAMAQTLLPWRSLPTFKGARGVLGLTTTSSAMGGWGEEEAGGHERVIALGHHHPQGLPAPVL